MVTFSQVWPIKQILALFWFSAYDYYGVNWINYAAIIVWMCCYGCQSVVYMGVIKNKLSEFVLVIFERERNSTANHKSNHCVHQFSWHLMGKKFWYCG